MKRLILATLMFTCLISSTAYAGQWFKDNSKWAYRDDSGNQIRDGWFTDVDGRVYNFNGGVVRSGFYSENGINYYFNPTSGERMSGLVVDNGKTYMYNLGGVQQTGWVSYGGFWYYFGTDGAMLTNKLLELNGDKYYLLSDGKMATNQWVDEGKYFSTSTGVIATNQWVDNTYVNSAGKATESGSKSSTDKKKIDNKQFTLDEYKQLATDAVDRYYDNTQELACDISDWRNKWNEDRVYNYTGDDDDYVDRNELPEFNTDDSEMNYAASLRAVELASCQRASGVRPDGRPMDTILSDLGINSNNVAESVAFGYDNASDCYSALLGNSSHTSKWKQKNYTRLGVGEAADADGKLYYVILYAE